MTARVIEHHTEIVPAANSGVLTPMDMLNQAVSQGANIDVLEKLMGLQERWEKNQARKAFDEAVANAKAEIPPIARDQKGHNEKRYVSFAAIARIVDPIITKHGLSYRFRTQQGDRINVTCVLSHKQGHYEETTLSGPADTTGNKNAIQAIGSTLTYLQRYSLIQALGLAASDDDDGAAVAAGGTITEEQTQELLDAIEAKGADIRKFCEHFRVDGVAQLPASQWETARQMLAKKKREAAQ